MKQSLTAVKIEENANILDCARPKSPAISENLCDAPSNSSPASPTFSSLPPFSLSYSLARAPERRKLKQRPSSLSDATEEIADLCPSAPLASDDHPNDQPLPLSYSSHDALPKLSVIFHSEDKGKPFLSNTKGPEARGSAIASSATRKIEGLCTGSLPPRTPAREKMIGGRAGNGALSDSDACDAPPNMHLASRQFLAFSASERLVDILLAPDREVVPSTSQRDRSGAPNISTSLFPRRSPLRLPPFGLPSFQLPACQLPPRSIELAQLIGEEIAPAPWVLSESEVTVLTESQLHQTIPVTGYDPPDPSSCHFSTGVQNEQVLTLAQPEARSSSQPDHDIEMAVDESMAHLRELELALQSIDTSGVLPCLTLSDIFMPLARSLGRPSERCTSELDRGKDWQPRQAVRTIGSQADRRQQPDLPPSRGPTTTSYRPESLRTSRHGEHIPCALSVPTLPGSPSLGICIPAELPNKRISKQSCREVAAPRSSDVVIKPNLPPNHFLPAAQSHLSSLPIPDRRDAPLADSYQNHPLDRAHPPLYSRISAVPTMVSEDAKSQPVKCLTKPTSPLPHLLPGLLEPITIHERTPEDSLRVSRGPRKGRAANHYRIYSRPQDIPKLDYGLPEDFGKHI